MELEPSGIASRKLPALPFLASPAALERAARVCVVLLFVGLFVGNACLLRPVLQNGDSAVYNQQIELKELGVRSTHFGYFVLGIVFNALLPLGTDMNMNVMLLSLGISGLVAVYLAAHQLSGSRIAGICSVCLALGLHSELRGMLLSEVDVAAASLIAIAFARFLRGGTVTAGALFGFSVLVTPLSGPMVVVFLLTIAVDTTSLRTSAMVHVHKLVKFAAAAVGVYLLPVLVNYQDYFYGSRGIFKAPRSAFPLTERLQRSFSFISSDAGLLVPVLAIGAVVCLMSARVWRLGQPALALLVSIFVMSLAGQQFTDVPVQLPNLVLLAILPAAAIARSRWTLAIAPVLIAAVCFFSLRANYARVLGEVAARDRDRKLCVGIREQSRPHEPVLVGVSGWGTTQMLGRLAGVGPNPATVISWRDFVRDEQRWGGPGAAHVFWFFRSVSARQLAPLLVDHALEKRAVEGRAFQVLIPRGQ
jgi:hypothetical protein